MQQNNSGILLSGGMDSIALAYWKRPKHAFTINYGQKPALSEIRSASQICKILEITHHIINVDCSELGSGDMNGMDALNIAPVPEWWPYRNQLLVTLACMKGVSIGINKLYVGSVKSDGAHKDGTNDFYKLLDSLVVYQEGEISIECPGIDISTKDLIKVSKIPTSVLMWAHSCHKSEIPCMSCNGCYKYLRILQELGIE